MLHLDTAYLHTGGETEDAMQTRVLFTEALLLETYRMPDPIKRITFSEGACATFIQHQMFLSDLALTQSSSLEERSAMLVSRFIMVAFDEWARDEMDLAILSLEDTADGTRTGDNDSQEAGATAEATSDSDGS
jgi:hypothetical protein